jgi:hypothetical protein
VANLKEFQSLLQSCFALLEQGAHFTLAKEILESTAVLMSLYKGMYLVECPAYRQ